MPCFDLRIFLPSPDKKGSWEYDEGIAQEIEAKTSQPVVLDHLEEQNQIRAVAACFFDIALGHF